MGRVTPAHGDAAMREVFHRRIVAIRIDRRPLAVAGCRAARRPR